MQLHQLASLNLFPLEARFVPAAMLSPSALTSTPTPVPTTTETPTAITEIVQTGTTEDGEAIYSMTYQPKKRQCSCAGCGSLASDASSVAVAAPVVVDQPQPLAPMVATIEPPPSDAQPLEPMAPLSLSLLMDETLPEVFAPQQVSTVAGSGLAFVATPDTTAVDEPDQIVSSFAESTAPVSAMVTFWETDDFQADEWLA